MSRTLAVGFLIIVAVVNATTAQTRTIAKPIGIGETAPDFTLVDHHGTKMTLLISGNLVDPRGAEKGVSRTRFTKNPTPANTICQMQDISCTVSQRLR